MKKRFFSLFALMLLIGAFFSSGSQAESIDASKSHRVNRKVFEIYEGEKKARKAVVATIDVLSHLDGTASAWCNVAYLMFPLKGEGPFYIEPQYASSSEGSIKELKADGDGFEFVADFGRPIRVVGKRTGFMQYQITGLATWQTSLGPLKVEWKEVPAMTLPSKELVAR